jgi:predicted transcriptional regulator
MSHVLKVELSDAVYATLESCAQASAKSPEALAAAALEQHFGSTNGRSADEAEKQAARERFERHFGAVDLGHPTRADNESIDADLARAYEDRHEGG